MYAAPHTFKYCKRCKDMAQRAEKRIPVSEEMWKQLGGMKEAGQTYEDLLQEMVQEYNRKKLAEKMSRVEEMDDDELVSLDEL